tara:strand:+ start:151 stop:543 length:393 start_codon:yes stop_codon:yes gene_type:complete
MGSTLEAQKKKAPKPKNVTYRDRDDLEIGRATTKDFQKGYKERVPKSWETSSGYHRRGALNALIDPISFWESDNKKAGKRAAKEDARALLNEYEKQRIAQDEDQAKRKLKFELEMLKRADGGMARKTRVF